MRAGSFILMFAATVALAPVHATAQAVLTFAERGHDGALPVEITADSLSVNRTDGTAVFTGNVKVAQGDLRLEGDNISVFYAADGSTVTRLEAKGSVFLSTGFEAAEAAEAVYDVASGNVSMAGDVILTQGPNALAGERLRIDLNTGAADMQGRVRTVIRPQGGQ